MHVIGLKDFMKLDRIVMAFASEKNNQNKCRVRCKFFRLMESYKTQEIIYCSTGEN